MTLEQKLEAALREAREALKLMMHSPSFVSTLEFQRSAITHIDAALSTPPTSEWNEAIEAATKVCLALGEYDYTDRSEGVADCVKEIRALRRKERP